MMAERIRVVVVDDQAIVRRALTMFLGACDDIEVIGEGSNGEEAVLLCAALRPDAVVMDMILPGTDGVSATRAIRNQNPNVQVIAISSSDDVKLVQSALQAGAAEYLPKDADGAALADAIRAAHTGSRRLVH